MSFWGYEPETDWIGNIPDEKTAVDFAERFPENIFFEAELVTEER